MAYLKSLVQKCQMCDKKATKQLFNRYNASCGIFCTNHAKTKLQELIILERKR